MVLIMVWFERSLHAIDKADYVISGRRDVDLHERFKGERIGRIACSSVSKLQLSYSEVPMAMFTPETKMKTLLRKAFFASSLFCVIKFFGSHDMRHHQVTK